MGCHSSLGGDALGLRSRVHGRSFHKARISFVNGICHGERGTGVAVVFVDRSFVCLITSFSPDYMQYVYTVNICYVCEPKDTCFN